jgi:shikimate dehydrogenase
MQNAGLAALKLNWRYLAFDVPPEELASALEGAKGMRFIGVNLTVPHKLLAVNLVDTLDVSAKTWGAVNTVCFEGKDEAGHWQPLRAFDDPPRQIRSHGFNTDAEAIVRSVHEDLGLDLAGARILLLGAGGAGRTAALKLVTEEIAEVKAEQLAREISERQPKVRVRVGYPRGEVDLVLNATSLGLHANDPLPFDPGQFCFRQGKAFYDMIYRPAETSLLRAARAAGRSAANGLGMLLYQGAKALEIWSGQAAPIEAMRRGLEKNVYG